MDGNCLVGIPKKGMFGMARTPSPSVEITEAVLCGYAVALLSLASALILLIGQRGLVFIAVNSIGRG